MQKKLVLWSALLFTVFVGAPAYAVCNSTTHSRFIGDWDFTTVVLGATKSSAIGVNGYYRMRIRANGCELEAMVAKLGFSNTTFSREKIQFGAASVRAYSVPDPMEGDDSPVLLVDAELASVAGSSLNVGFTFAGEEGFWRYLGSSWASAGMWGALQTNKIESAEVPFSAPKKLSCRSYRFGGDSPTAVAFNCAGLLVATPGLDRLTWHHSKTNEVGRAWFDNVAATGQDDGGWVDYCSGAREGMEVESYVTRIYVGDAHVRGGQPSASSAKKCGVRPAASPNRWNGGVK